MSFACVAALCRLVPLLIQRLRYSEEELADLPVKDVVDEGVPDAAEDVKPYLYRAKDEEDDPDTTAVHS